MTVRERNIQLPLDQIQDFCRRNPIQKLSLFGSVLRDDFQDRSDVDFLVEFLPGSRMTYFSMADMESELESIVHRKVDLRTPQEIHERFRQRVLDSAEIIYAAD